jgi:hypothetical protein
VVLCADCRNAAGAARAEQMRKNLARLPQPALGGIPITASFGVTEVQPGDTPETMLRRADRALLQAKQRGRNMVVQLGTGIGEQEEPAKGFSWFRRPTAADLVVQKHLVTTVPMKMAVEKIRGFVADHHAEIVSIDNQVITLKVSAGWSGFLKRQSDRPVAFEIELRLNEERPSADAEATNGVRALRTQVHLIIRPLRSRDRRRTDLATSARQLCSSVKSYLMANDEEEIVAETQAPSGISTLLPWLRQS